jgi:hypothetical protein
MILAQLSAPTNNHQGNLMRSHLLSLIMFAGLGFGQTSAQASLLHPLEYHDGTLAWLELSETAGLSINDIDSGAGGWNTKYRFATDAEVAGLMNSLSLVTTDYTATPVPGISDFIYKLGGMTADGMAGTWFSQGNEGANGRGLNAFIRAGFTNGDSGTALSPGCPAYFNCMYADVTYGPQSHDAAVDTTGIFLVRDLPEPPTPALMAMAGALLIARRARRA